MCYCREFTDFVLDVVIPSHWEDTSYRNDRCPSWSPGVLETGEVVRVWVDYARPEQREFPSSKRYLVDLDAETGMPLSPALLSTDSWDDVLALVALLTFNVPDHERI